jgi:hypothetical protein
MHAASHAKKFDVRYTQTQFTKHIRHESNCRSRLSKEDRNPTLRSRESSCAMLK